MSTRAIWTTPFHEDSGAPLVHDWRAPVSSLFYDFETGDAFYDTPAGRVDCRLERKRQYRIEKGELVFMLETSLNIHDDVLQRELSRASDDKMKNIVATIQRDQNAIIRDEHAHALIIQGAAGSGKTSIALHRIAFLLYRFKETIRSNDILIISPNKVFAHYISQVLPELGEEMIRETTMEAIATQLLGEDVTFQSFAEQVAALLRGGDERYADRIRFKATPAFVDELEQYGREISNRRVRAKNLTLGKHTVPADWIADRFQACGPMPFANKLNEVTESVVDWMRTQHEVSIAGKQRAQRIHRNPQLEPIERHGDAPQIISCRDADHEIEFIRQLITEFLDSEHHSLGIICKTQDQADALYQKLQGASDRIRLLTPLSSVFSAGVIIATAHLAKGLEFDRVIVPHCTGENYARVIDRHMLYVACTRAMHRLTRRRFWTLAREDSIL